MKPIFPEESVIYGIITDEIKIVGLTQHLQ